MRNSNCSLEPLINHFSSSKPFTARNIFDNDLPNVVEIGFGLGEVLIKNAIQHPNKNYIGIEQHWERIYKTLVSVESHATQGDSLENLKILDVDAWVAFERLFEERSIDDIYCLFPCPWPKKSHTKHRLFSAEFWKLLNNRLLDDKKILLVTDDVDYFEWVLAESVECGFEIQTDRVKPSFKTKFENKWRAQGQDMFWSLTARKTKHQMWEFKKDHDVKAYRINNFDPAMFKFEDIKGRVGIIFKDFLFDVKREKGLVHLIVSEGRLTQHIRVAIVKSGDYWKVVKADGQQFFATPGVQQAVDAVYQSVNSSN